MGGISGYGGDLIFQYALPISAVGSVMFAIIALANLNMADVIANKTASILINLIVGLAGLITISFWFNYDIPLLGGIINDTITIYGKNNKPKLAVNQ
jgi:uncharacterized membrane protein YuzA (DUF378 family)